MIEQNDHKSDYCHSVMLCEKCKDWVVYPMVALCHMPKQARYSDQDGDSADVDNVASVTSLQPKTSNSSSWISVSNYRAE